MSQIAGFFSFYQLNPNAIRDAQYDIRKNVLSFELTTKDYSLTTNLLEDF